jgi:hypothetical protein
MLAGTVPPVAIVFVAVAVIFAGAALRDFLIAEGKLTAARRGWLRMAFIFAAVAVGLFVWHTFLI